MMRAELRAVLSDNVTVEEFKNFIYKYNEFEWERKTRQKVCVGSVFITFSFGRFARTQFIWKVRMRSFEESRMSARICAWGMNMIMGIWIWILNTKGQKLLEESPSRPFIDTAKTLKTNSSVICGMQAQF